MSDTVASAVDAINNRLSGQSFEGSAKFVIEGEGSVRIDETGASADDAEADVTMTADAETFEGILSGDINPTSAVMTGKLTIDGDMGMAMKLASVLS